MSYTEDDKRREMQNYFGFEHQNNSIYNSPSGSLSGNPEFREDNRVVNDRRFFEQRAPRPHSGNGYGGYSPEFDFPNDFPSQPAQSFNPYINTNRAYHLSRNNANTENYNHPDYRTKYPPSAWEMPMFETKDYRGVGPKNYTRTDTRIEEDICDRLCEHPYVDASDIEVKVNNGDVTITGSVASKSIKRFVEDMADDVSGVKNVENRMRIGKQETNISPNLGE